MKNLLQLCFCGMLATGCGPEPPPCPVPEERWVAVGFYRSKSPVNYYEGALDTTFTSVYALGTKAELGNRRINNYFMLPIPLAGGRVDYVFEQEEKQQVLSLFFTTGAMLDVEDCGVIAWLDKTDILQEHTSLQADSIRTGNYFNYVHGRSLGSEMAVFVP